MDERDTLLIAEQARHALDLLKADNEALRAELGHYRELTDRRLGRLEQALDDHESRIRASTDGVTQFKVLAGLASGGSGLMSLAALLRAFLGG